MSRPRLVIPGGESTTIGKLMVEYGLLEPLRARIAGGMPTFGTCAGAIVLARDIGRDQPLIGAMVWTLPGELGFYCRGNPQVFTFGAALSDRFSQYDVWRPNPVAQTAPTARPTAPNAAQAASRRRVRERGL